MKGWLLALVIARSLDAASTCLALQKYRAAERNPLLPSSCSAAVAAEGSLATFQVWGLSRMAKRHPKVAMFVTIVSTSVEGYAAVHNLRVK